MTPRAPEPLPRLALSAALVAALCVCATGAPAKTSDRNQRTNVKANSQDCSLDESGPCIFTGAVKIVQGTLDIEADRADVRRGGGELRAIKLNGGPVRLKQQNDDGSWVNATATQIDYDLPNNTVVLSGSAVVQQPGRGSISGERIVYNMKTGQVQSGAAAGSKQGVNMTFEPKSSTPATEGPKKTKKKTPPGTSPAQNGPEPAQPQDKQ